LDSVFLDYLYRLGEFNIKLGLDTIRSMLERLGNPHRHPRIIHIAGTNGKGSTLIALESLLMTSGYSTGSTISPHLLSFNERFRINGKPVDDATLNQAFQRVCNGCGIRLHSPVSEDGLLRPTFFEFAMAMAFVIFESAGVDFILLETGLGGRLDATNVIETPLACVITRIAMDHQEYLGDTLEQITTEKLGILKRGSPVFVAKQEKRVKQFIHHYCRSTSQPAFFWPEDFFATRSQAMTVFHTRSAPTSCSANPGSISTSIRKNGLLGAHQTDNVLCALAVYHFAVPAEKRLGEKETALVIAKLHWPGRLHYLGREKKILLDGAHNGSGIKSLMDYLQAVHPDKRILFAVGWMKKKELFSDIDMSMSQFRNIRFIPMQMESTRSETVDNVCQKLSQTGCFALPAMNCRELAAAHHDGRLPAHDLLVVAGSLYLVGEFLNHWKSMGNI